MDLWLGMKIIPSNFTVGGTVNPQKLNREMLVEGPSAKVLLLKHF